MVARLRPYVNPSSDCFTKFSIYAAGHGDRGDGRRAHLNGRGCSRGRGGRVGRGRGGHIRRVSVGRSGAHENGIDISDVTRYFEDSDWAALSNDTRKRITEEPVCTKFLANKNRRTTSYVSSEKDN